jgi:hypothetical protein
LADVVDAVDVVAALVDEDPDAEEAGAEAPLIRLVRRVTVARAPEDAGAEEAEAESADETRRGLAC